MAPRVSIVRAGAERIDDLAPLWMALQEHHAAVAPTLAGLDARSPECSWRFRREKYAAALADPDAFLLVAERSGDPVGYALVTIGESPAGWTYGERLGNVETVSVRPDAQGRGIGTRLMNAVEDELSRLGIAEFRVLVIAANDDALRFYEHRGLTTISHVLLGRTRRIDAGEGDRADDSRNRRRG